MLSSVAKEQGAVVPKPVADPLADPQRAKESFRNYTNGSLHERVDAFYHENHRHQSFDFASKLKDQYIKLDKLEMNIWDALVLLNEVVDYSDPDTNLPQIMHLLQTAEAIRAAWPGEEYDWFHLVGLIHDLGKVLAHPKLFNEPQWAVVGDTFPVGCAFSEKIVFSQYFNENPDHTHPVYNTKFGLYHEGIGLDNVTFSWGHDEYMYQVCVQNKCTLPLPALYMIRYHSFYAWHNAGEYEYLTNETDREMLSWVQAFQKHDLYSKLPVQPKLEELLPYYKQLVNKYFPAILKW